MHAGDDDDNEEDTNNNKETREKTTNEIANNVERKNLKEFCVNYFSVEKTW